jgi:PAS domain S-box-containing protein
MLGDSDGTFVSPMDDIRWLTQAVEQSPASIILTDVAGNIAYVNPQFTRTTGYPSAEVLGKNPRVLQSGVTPPETYRDLWATIGAGRVWRGDLQNRRKDGTPYWHEVIITPVRGADGAISHYLAIQQDVTEQRAAAEALRAREEIFRQVTENIREVFFLVAADYSHTLYVSPAYDEVWGRSRDEMYRNPRAFIEAVVPEDRDELYGSVAGLQAGDAGPDVEYRIRRPDGEVRWILGRASPVLDEDGRVYRIAGVAHDITERKRTKQALEEAAARVGALMDHANDGIAVLEPDGTVREINQRMLSIVGRRRDDAVGRPLEAFGAVTAEAGLARGQGITQDVEVVRPDETVAVVEVSARLVERGPDRVVLAIGRDVTAQRSLEIQFRQAQKMEAVGRLAGGVAHDFNNVLSAIFGYADLVAETLPEGSAARDDVDEIRRAAQRAAGLTRQLLAFSRQQVLEPVILNVNDLIEDFMKMLGRLLGADVAVETLLAPDVGNVRADPGQLHQVILNLAVNARDAMPSGGSLIIETANVELTEAYATAHQPVIPGAFVMLAIADNGVGMDAATRGRVFEPFFTTKPKGKGTGLGLSTAYGIVKQSGGYIWVYSEPGRGTTFKVYLPRVDEEVGPAQPVTDLGVLTGTETVLLVEDDEILRPLTRELLRRWGYTVLDAADAAEAETIARGHRGIDLLLTDVVMPGDSGPQLAERLLGERPSLRVLFMSGYTDDTVIRHGLLPEGVAYLQKPFTPEGLAVKLRRVLDHA